MVEYDVLLYNASVAQSFCRHNTFVGFVQNSEYAYVKNLYGVNEGRKRGRPDIPLPYPSFTISCTIRGKELGLTCTPPSPLQGSIFIAFSLSTSGMIICVNSAHEAIFHRSFECAFVTSSGQALCVMHQEHLAIWRLGKWSDLKGPDLMDTPTIMQLIQKYLQQEKSLDSIPLVSFLVNQRYLLTLFFSPSPLIPPPTLPFSHHQSSLPLQIHQPDLPQIIILLPSLTFPCFSPDPPPPSILSFLNFIV